MGPRVEYSQTLRLLQMVILHSKMKWPLLTDPDLESDVTANSFHLTISPPAAQSPSTAALAHSPELVKPEEPVTCMLLLYLRLPTGNISRSTAWRPRSEVQCRRRARRLVCQRRPFRSERRQVRLCRRLRRRLGPPLTREGRGGGRPHRRARCVCPARVRVRAMVER